jgi:hypothetical protein
MTLIDRLLALVMTRRKTAAGTCPWIPRGVILGKEECLPLGGRPVVDGMAAAERMYLYFPKTHRLSAFLELLVTRCHCYAVVR